MERPPGFVLRERRKGLFRRTDTPTLHCEDVPLTKLAERYGTPLYVYSATSILARLAELFPGRSVETLVTDLLHAALDEIVAAMPYEAGPKIISRDDQGDPVYEDVGLTPRFAELTRKLKKSLPAGP